MIETMQKMMIAIKKTLTAEYGEQFTGMSEEAQAATVAKVLSDMVRVDAKVAAILAEKYLAEIA